MKKHNLIALLVMVSLVSACTTQRHFVNGISTDNARIIKENQDFFIGGIGQEKTANAAKACGGASKVIAIETKYTPLNIVLNILTWGIYSPRQQAVYCS